MAIFASYHLSEQEYIDVYIENKKQLRSFINMNVIGMDTFHIFEATGCFLDEYAHPIQFILENQDGLNSLQVQLMRESITPALSLCDITSSHYANTVDKVKEIYQELKKISIDDLIDFD